MNNRFIAAEQDLFVLFTNLINSIDLHVVGVSSDLQQTGAILDDAIIKLSESFHGIHQSLDCRHDTDMNQQQELLMQHLQQALISLQFHDITTQLLQRATMRLEGVNKILLAVEAIKSPFNEESKTDEFLLRVKEVDKTLMQLNGNLDNLLVKSLPQQDMNSGDVQLF
jgi:hypothetical protein